MIQPSQLGITGPQPDVWCLP